jgi:hypothetical protein
MLANCKSLVLFVLRSNIYVKSRSNWQTECTACTCPLLRHRIINCITENIKSALFSQNLGHECFLISFCSSLISRLVSDGAGDELWIKNHMTIQATLYKYFKHFGTSTVFNYFVRWNLSFTRNRLLCMNGHVSLSLNLFNAWLLSLLLEWNLLLILWKLPVMKLY